jgi:maleate isomerase
VTPHVDDIQREIVATFAREGVDVVAEEHLGISDNLSFAHVDADTVNRMVGNVVAARPDAIAVICTNLAAAPLVDGWETHYGVPVHDTIATAVYGARVAVGKDPAMVSGFGRLFR